MNKTIQIGKRNYNIFSDDNYLHEVGNVFEPHMLSLFDVFVDKNDIVADIGANIGLTSIWFSNHAKNVYSFEPSTSTYQILQKNLNSASATNVAAINIGIGSKEENLTITFPKKFRAGAYISQESLPSQEVVCEKIQVSTLDKFFKDKKEKPSFLKIDVEGYENKVVEGALNLLQLCKPIVVMEMNVFCLNVLHRVCLPDFVDRMKSIFPVLYAIDANNKSILNLHQKGEAYTAMHDHIVNRRYPNLVGGFHKTVADKLIKFVAKNLTVSFQGKCKERT